MCTHPLLPISTKSLRWLHFGVRTCPSHDVFAFAHGRHVRYFLDKWNVLDVLTVMFVFVAFVFRMIELQSGEGSHLFVAQFFLASTAPLLSSRVLFLSQIGRALGPMTQVGEQAVGEGIINNALASVSSNMLYLN